MIPIDGSARPGTLEHTQGAPWNGPGRFERERPAGYRSSRDTPMRWHFPFEFFRNS
jgi:hypothetical protein